MKSTFKVLFYARKNQVNKNGEVGIMIRISLNGENIQFSSKLNVNPSMWDAQGNRGIGRFGFSTTENFFNHSHSSFKNFVNSSR